MYLWPDLPQFFNSGSSQGDEIEVDTDPDSDHDASVGGKRSRQGHNQRYVLLNTPCCHVLIVDCRALKRTKTYESFGNVHPTIRNKPSGLVNTWYNVTTTPSPHQTAPQVHGHPPNPLAFYTPSQSRMDQSPPFPSHPLMAQFQPTSIQSTRPPHMSMDIPAMTAPPSVLDPALSAPFTESDDSFWFPPAGPSRVRWESAVNEMNPVTISFPPTMPF